jgi:class 3 adenylate cyclase
MAIFMDRHDFTDASAKDVAAAHVHDLGIQERHGVRFLSYWFDVARQAAFCLVEAPNAEAVQAAHRDGHGLTTNEIIPVDPTAVQGFLGRLDDPTATGRAPESAFRIILFTDLEGSTNMTQRLGDEGAMRLLGVHDAIIRDALSAHGGREVKHTGDGIMASFGSIQNALGAAIEVQRGFACHNADSEPGGRLAVRIGLSAGEPVAQGSDLFGAAVQLAARLTAYAKPGRIMIAGVVADLAIGKKFTFGPRTVIELRGFPEPIVACELEWAAGG